MSNSTEKALDVSDKATEAIIWKSVAVSELNLVLKTAFDVSEEPIISLFT
jgi:hypothetical protein